MLLFTAVGVYAATQKQDTTADYLLAGRKVNPWAIALSALSSGQSGFLFTAQVGYAYTQGLSAIWLAIGWAIGDYLAWLLVFKRLRLVSEASDSETVPAFLAQKQPGDRWISIISALITIFFLGTRDIRTVCGLITAFAAIAIMLIGIFVSMYWKLGLKLSGAVYEVLPGMAAALLVYAIALLFTKQDKKELN